MAYGPEPLGLPGYQNLPAAGPPDDRAGSSGIAALFAALAAHPGGMPAPGLPQQVDPGSAPPVVHRMGSDHRFLGQSHQSPQAALQTLQHLGGILRQLGHPAFQGHTLPGVPGAHQLPFHPHQMHPLTRADLGHASQY